LRSGSLIFAKANTKKKKTSEEVYIFSFPHLLGIVHGEAKRLLEEKMLMKQRSSRDSNPDCEGIRPSLFALDSEAPGELVPDLPANRYSQCSGSESIFL
jgi:hypothetical protein